MPAITTFHPAISPGQSPGTGTNDNAAVGYIGEFFESIILAASEISLTSGVRVNVTSFALSAGDWDVYGVVTWDINSTTAYTSLVAASSIVSATVDFTDGSSTLFIQQSEAPGSTGILQLPIPMRRLSLASTTTVYLVASGNFTVSTLKVYGVLRARRAR